MIVTRRETNFDDINVGKDTRPNMVPADDLRLAEGDSTDNEMPRDDVFHQLEDESHVVSSGRGSRLPITDSEGGMTPSGYSAGVGSGSGTD